MKLYHPLSEQEEATVLARGFWDTPIPFGVDDKGRCFVRVAVGFINKPPPQRIGYVWLSIDVPDWLATVFEDTEPGSPSRYFYLPAALATYFLRQQKGQN